MPTLDQINLFRKVVFKAKTLLPDEKKINDDDSAILKALKKGLKPIMVDAQTQTDFIYTLTKDQKKEIEGEITKFQNLAEKYKNELSAVNILLDKTKQSLSIEIKHKQDALIENSKMKGTYELKTGQLTEEIRHLNKDIEDYIEKLKTAEQTGDQLTQEKLHISEECERIKNDLEAMKNLEKVNEELKKQIKEKPVMKEMWTQTELSAFDIVDMDATIKRISELVNTQGLVNTETKEGKKIMFDLSIIERGVATLEENRQHNEQNGVKLKEQLEETKRQILEGKHNESSLKIQVEEIKELLKRKETEHQKSLKVKEEEWNKLRQNLGEKLKEAIEKAGEEKNDYKRELETMEENIKRLENLDKDKTEQIRVINESKELVEVEKSKVLSEVDNLKKQLSKSELTEKELTEKNQQIKDLEEKLKQQSYLLGDISIYRDSFFVPINGYSGWFAYSFCSSGYVRNQLKKDSYLTRHTKKKIVAFVFEIKKLFSGEYSKNDYYISDYEGGLDLYHTNPTSFTSEEWKKINDTYADRGWQTTADLRFLVDEMGFKPQTYIFMKDFFDKGGGWDDDENRGDSEPSYLPYRFEREIVSNNASVDILFKTVSYSRGGGNRPFYNWNNSQADFSKFPIIFYSPVNSFHRPQWKKEEKIYKVKHGRMPDNDYRWNVKRRGDDTDYLAKKNVNFSVSNPQITSSKEFIHNQNDKAYSSKMREDEYKIVAKVNFNPPF